MPAKKSYLARLPKDGRTEVETIMRERDGELSFIEHVAKSWDFELALRPGPFKTADQRRRLDDYRRQIAAERPDWSPDQVEDYMRLAFVSGGLRERAIARRCALDDPGELGRLLAARNRLRLAAIADVTGSVVEPCATGDIEIARELASRTPLGNQATPGEEDLHSYAFHALLLDNRPAFQWLVEQFDYVSSSRRRAWLTSIYAALQGVRHERPADVARGLHEHIGALRKMRQRDALEAAINLSAHWMYRLFESISPTLVSQFDAAQDSPWDAQFHAWVSEHPDPVAGWDLSNTPELLQAIVGRGEQPAWLRSAKSVYELVLISGDPGSKPLLETIERLGGGNDGTVTRAKRMLENCPVVLCWGLEGDAGRDALHAQQRQIEALGGQAEVCPMRRREFLWFSA